ncbi:EAL domain-containing protein [Azoarcus sp. KH32C]|uniref:bifunctional diguanylate cyclase/phosphodiesterase n=1 Tax=Azoarcus sp. KH32C TaxID=748247 RepID=UPI001E4F8367|nr:EAL domain-containing protein [Azoarcus sp. KH32C]
MRRGSLARVVAHQMIVFVALLLIAIQLVIFVVIDKSIHVNALRKIHEEIQVGDRIFLRLLEDRSRRLVDSASILTSDFAFRQALMTGDSPTVASALANHGARISAEKMILVAPDQKVLADASAGVEAHIGRPFAFPELIAEAAEKGSASAIKALDGGVFQLVVVPVLAPVPVAWAVLGFRIDTTLAGELGLLTSLDVSFAAWRPGSGWEIVGSTMPFAPRGRLLGALAQYRPESLAAGLSDLSGEDYVVSVSSLATGPEGNVVAILQRSLADAVAQFASLRVTLLILAGLSLAGTIVGSLMIARSISRPVTALVAFARRLERGDYDQGPPETGADELGELATAFDNMRLAIFSREQQIKAMAYHDALTGLPNRALFNDRLNQAVGVARRLGHPVSVMLIDLNRFKEVNDTLGHHVGDLLLREVATRLRGALLRASDTVARLGGDEFAVLLPAATKEMAEDVARRILLSLEDPVSFEGRMLDVEGSIGFACFPEHADEMNVLMSRADAAMYYAKRRHLGAASFDARLKMEPEIDSRLSLSSELRQAIERNEFMLHYQPRLDLQDRSVRQVEALVRWQHPTHGFVFPAEFIPFGEQTGFIREITYWVMNRVFADVVRWRQQGLEVTASINFSVRDLLNAEIGEHVRELLTRHGAEPSWFVIEITESSIMDDPVRALETAAELRAMGFQLSIDDFGSGYSSLALIKKLPIAELKIDRSFIANMASDRDDLMIVRSVIDLAHNMGLRVVGEGVESAESLALLEELGCDVVQGYHIFKPVPFAEIQEWFALRGAEGQVAARQPGAGEGVT